MVFYPQGVDLRFHTLSLANGLIAAPLTALAGPVISHNVLFFAWTTFTGVFASLWARGHGLSVYAAALVGVIAAFSPYRMNHLIHLNLFSTACVFCAFWLCDRMFNSQSKAAIFLFSLAWIWTALTDWYYAIFVGLYWLLRILFSIKNKTGIKHSIQITLPTVVMGMLVYLYFFMGASQRPTIEADSVPVQVSAFWSFDLLHLVTPTWALGEIIDISNESEFLIHPGLFILLFGVWGAIRSKQIRSKIFLLVCAGLFFFLSLGPMLKFNQSPIEIAGFPLVSPTILYSVLPMLDSMRVFTRFAYVGFVILSIFAALNLERFINRLNTPQLRLTTWIAIAALFLIETGYKYPAVEKYEPPIQIAQDINAPIFLATYLDTRYSGLAMYHQTIHHQPIAIAEFSRLGGYKQQYLTKYRLFEAISVKLFNEPYSNQINAFPGDLPLPIETMAVYSFRYDGAPNKITIHWPDQSKQIIKIVYIKEVLDPIQLPRYYINHPIDDIKGRI